MKVGFIGLGLMGRGMAANVQKAGYELVVHDLFKDAAKPFLSNFPRAITPDSQWGAFCATRGSGIIS